MSDVAVVDEHVVAGTMYPISREDLVALAETAIEKSECEGWDPELAESARRVAATEPRVAFDWWSALGDCGCLVGAIIGPDVLTHAMTPSQRKLGLAFFGMAERRVNASFKNADGSYFEVA